MTNPTLADCAADMMVGTDAQIMNAMIGQTLLGFNINRDTENYNDRNDEITLQFKDADVTFYHDQDCCERIVIDDINGDFSDMVGDVLLVADERMSDDHETTESCDVMNTWTFYTFRSVRGSVDVKWHGSSNGCYSEEVDIKVMPPTYVEPKTGETR